MPRRGRHRTSLPVRLVAAAAALLLTAGVVVVAGSAAADDGDGGLLSSLTSGSRGSDDSDSDSGDSDSKDSDSDSDSGDSDSKDSDSGDSDSRDSDSKDSDSRSSKSSRASDDEDDDEKHSEAKVDDEDKEEEFPGRDEIAPAGQDDYVDITSVRSNNNIGEGGIFGGGSYSIDCGLSDHRNSDNYMAAPGKRNGAQHTHDYVGNRTTDAFTDHDSLQEGATSCRNGDQSTFFWPVVRDLNGVGPDVGRDGGSLDGNVGAILTPSSVDLRFHGYRDQEARALPQGLMMIMGNAKAKVQDGENANAKYTCSGFTDRVTSKYPICPSGSKLIRYLDYPSCWDGENLESKDFRSHIRYTDDDGRCGDDEVALPQLRITLTYDQPAGRSFSLDSFPDNQHHPSTDHSDYENVATSEQNTAGAECINAGRRCDT